MKLEVASDYTQLAFHALALVPVPGPANLHDLGYAAWAKRHLPPEAIEPIARDAALIGRGGDALQWAPELFRDVAHLRASAARDVLLPGDVTRPRALAEWNAGSPGTELLRAALCLAADAFAGAWPAERCRAGLATYRDAFERAGRLYAPLAEARVEVAWALGARGRAYATRLVVGVPGDWSGAAPETPAVIALHEAAVRRENAPYAIAEWRALTTIAERVRSGDDALRDAHRAWLARLALDDLLDAAVERGECGSERARRIRALPNERPERLARA